MPDELLGNWIDTRSNDWVVGFFEPFAIYQSDFWSYESVQVVRKVAKGSTTEGSSAENSPAENSSAKGKLVNAVVTLAKDGQTLRFSMKLDKKGRLVLTPEAGTFALKSEGDRFGSKRTAGKPLTCVKMGTRYPLYPKKDKAFFAEPTFNVDTATIIGYLHHWKDIPAQFAARLTATPFSVAVHNLVTNAQDKHMADIDSLGRFKLRFPLLNAQELYVDWSRLNCQGVMEPGDTLFLFADLLDYLPRVADGSMEGYMQRPKQLLFMGENARLNNELEHYKPIMMGMMPRVQALRPSDGSHEASDTAFMAFVQQEHALRSQVLDSFLTVYPEASEKFVRFRWGWEQWNVVRDLMQHRFTHFSKADRRLDPAFLAYVREQTPTLEPWMLTLFREYQTYVRDWVGYHNDVYGQRSVFVTIDSLVTFLKQTGAYEGEVVSTIDDLEALFKTINEADSVDRAALFESRRAEFERLNGHPVIKQGYIDLMAEVADGHDKGDSLLTCEPARALWWANRFFGKLDQHHQPLSPRQLLVMREKVGYPDVVAQLEQISAFYAAVKNKGMTYEASLKNTEHLKEYKDAKALFDTLIAPYRGKVIYLDFWGTWCGPCKENMKLVKPLKEKFNERNDIVFMYLANRSPEADWKSVIAEMDLTGENVVHFRLPDEQQAMIERLFNVSKFPTYLLINKEGVVVDTDAKSPRQGIETYKQIASMLLYGTPTAPDGVEL